MFFYSCRCCLFSSLHSHVRSARILLSFSDTYFLTPAAPLWESISVIRFLQQYLSRTSLFLSVCSSNSFFSYLRQMSVIMYSLIILFSVSLQDSNLMFASRCSLVISSTDCYWWYSVIGHWSSCVDNFFRNTFSLFCDGCSSSESFTFV